MALLIWIQSLMELAFGLLFWLFGLRSFGLAWRVVQEMCRKPLFEDSQRRLRIVFMDLIYSSFAISASIFRVGHIVFRENGVIRIQRAQQCDQVYSIRSMVLVHTEGPPSPILFNSSFTSWIRISFFGGVAQFTTFVSLFKRQNSLPRKTS